MRSNFCSNVLVISLIALWFIPSVIAATLLPNPNPPLVSNAAIDVGQISVFNTIVANAVGGVAINGYTFNWFWIAPNIMNGGSNKFGNTIFSTVANVPTTGNNIALIFNAFTSNQINLQEGGSLGTANVVTNTLLTTTSNNALGVWTINAFVIDSNGLGTNTVITAASTITVNAAISATILSSSNSLADQGQVETVTYTIAGGTPPYTYNFLVSNSGTGNVIANQIYTGCTLTTNSFTFTIPTSNPNAIGSLTLSGNVIDKTSFTSGVSNLITTNTITMFSSPTVTLIATPSNSVNWNIAVTLNALVTGGTGTDTFVWTQNNGAITATTVNSVSSSFTISNAQSLPGTFVYSVVATDNGLAIPQVSNTVVILQCSTCGGAGNSGGGVNPGNAGPGPGPTTVTATTTASTTTAATSVTSTILPIITNKTYTVSNTPTTVSLPGTGTTLSIQSQTTGTGSANVLVTNATKTSPAAPSGLNKLLALNISLTTSVNVSTNVSMSYPCSLPASSVAPYKFKNNAWVKYSSFIANAVACTITFSITKDPLVALFQNVTPTTLPTTSPTTAASTLPPSVTPPSQSPSSTPIIIALIIIIILIVLYYYWWRSQKR